MNRPHALTGFQALTVGFDTSKSGLSASYSAIIVLRSRSAEAVPSEPQSLCSDLPLLCDVPQGRVGTSAGNFIGFRRLAGPLGQILCFRWPARAVLVKGRADHIKRLNVRSPVQEFSENLHHFWITA
jgi:hypothetical protein